MTKSIVQSIKQTVLWTIIAGVLYPAGITLVAQVAFRDQANGSLIERNGTMVGSALIAQQFKGDGYFWPRPSAGSYATVPSGASNYGPTSKKLRDNVDGFAERSARSAQTACGRAGSCGPGFHVRKRSRSSHQSGSSAIPDRARRRRRATCPKNQYARWWRNSSSRRSGVSSARPVSTC